VSVLTSAGPKLVVLGGFGWQEVDEEEGEEEEDAMEAVEEAGQGGIANKEAKSEEDNTVAVGYLADVWTIDMAGTCTELGDDEVTFISGRGEVAAPAWGAGGTKRGAKLVRSSQGIISFGGFDGELFCGALEKVELKL